MIQIVFTIDDPVGPGLKRFLHHVRHGVVTVVEFVVRISENKNLLLRVCDSSSEISKRWTADSGTI